jgi:hypothetical protein
VHYGACPLGHDKLDTTARYTRFATGLIANLASPLETIIEQRRRKNRKGEPPAK